MTSKTRANPDYSQSSVNANEVPGLPVNPPEVIDLYRLLRQQQANLLDIQKQIDESIPETYQIAKAAHLLQIAETDKELRNAIEAFGSYQDTAKGEYAVKHRRDSITFTPKLVRENAPAKVAEFVIIQAVNVKALEALQKAGQIDEKTLMKCGEIKTTYAFIIK